MKLSEKLKELRKEHGMTQDELAEKLFVTRTAVSKWETEQGYPSIESLKMLSKLFGVTIDELVSDEDIDRKVEIDKKKSKKHLIYAGVLFCFAFVCTVLAIVFSQHYIYFFAIAFGVYADVEVNISIRKDQLFSKKLSKVLLALVWLVLFLAVLGYFRLCFGN